MRMVKKNVDADDDDDDDDDDHDDDKDDELTRVDDECCEKNLQC